MRSNYMHNFLSWFKDWISFIGNVRLLLTILTDFSDLSLIMEGNNMGTLCSKLSIVAL